MEKCLMYCKSKVLISNNQKFEGSKIICCDFFLTKPETAY
jgi:hypothetical protein